MKRPPHPFVVEVRRQRRSPGEPARSWFEEPRPAETAPTPASAVFAEPARAPADPAPPRPAGRILPSLVDPPVAPPGDEPRAGRPRRAKSAAAKTPAPAERPAAKPPASLKKRAPRRAAPPPRAPAPPPVQTDVPASPTIPRAAAESSPPARAERHARILERYVFGGEAKPSARWKLRPRRGG